MYTRFSERLDFSKKNVQNDTKNKFCFGYDYDDANKSSFIGKIVDITVMNAKYIGHPFIQSLVDCSNSNSEQVSLTERIDKRVNKITVAKYKICKDRYIIYQLNASLSYPEAIKYSATSQSTLITTEEVISDIEEFRSKCTYSSIYRSWLKKPDKHLSTLGGLCPVLFQNGSTGYHHCISETKCTILKLPTSLHLTLYGNLPYFDREYFLRKTTDGITLLGSDNCVVKFEDSNWVLKSDIINIYWILQDSYLPFGRNVWRSSDNKTSLIFTLSACPAGMILCSDGDCVHPHKRCDGTADCFDASDEKNCRLIVKNPGYNVKLPPPNTFNHRRIFRFKISIFSISDISTVNGIAEIDFSITISWKDPRLTIWNANNYKEIINCDDIWSPVINLVAGSRSSGHNLEWHSYSTSCSVTQIIEGKRKSLDDPYMGKILIYIIYI